MYKLFNNNNIINKIDPKLYFDFKGMHGVLHVYRVLKLILRLGIFENLTENEMTILFYSGLYHDIGRTNNLVDVTHGIKSYKKIIDKGLLNNIKDLESEDIEIMRFIIEQHAISDDIGKKNIINYSINDKNKAFKLYEIFKDADGLDRVRIGDLNISYLRRKYSKTLVDEEHPNHEEQEMYKANRQRLIDKTTTKEYLGEIKYSYLNALLLPKFNNCNMIYNPEIENSKCDTDYFLSIIDDLNNINKIQPINDINDLKDHILWLKQNADIMNIMDIQIKDNDINIIPYYNQLRLVIYPVKKKNYHLFHGTSIANAKSIIADGYIKANKKSKSLLKKDFNKVFLSNSTKYASIYSMSGGSSNILSTFVDNNKKPNEYSIVFQIDTSKYDVYHYNTYVFNEEYFIWDNVSVKDIEKIYLMRYCEIVKEIKLSELNDLNDIIEIDDWNIIMNLIESTNNEQEKLKSIIKSLIDKKITKEVMGVKRYCYFNACYLSKINNCNMIYNADIENNKCTNGYFKSIINDLSNIDKIQSIDNINDLKDHILWLKQNSDAADIMDIQIKDNSIDITPNYNQTNSFIYPIKKKNYRLFHGTSIAKAKSILKDGCIKAAKIFKEEMEYNKVFFSNSTKYASIYGMTGGSSEWGKVWNEDSKKFNEYSIVFQIDTSKYDVYHYSTYVFNEEYFIWGNISVKDIEKIYLMERSKILIEVKPSELNNFGNVITINW